MNMQQEQIMALVAQQLADLIASFDNDHRRQLREYNLTSLQLVNLVVSLEDHFEIQFTPEEITGPDFSTAASIGGLVARKLA